jgi:hypothetical protein
LNYWINGKLEKMKGNNKVVERMGMSIKKFGEPYKGSPKYITNTPKYSYEFKRFLFLTTYFMTIIRYE